MWRLLNEITATGTPSSSVAVRKIIRSHTVTGKFTTDEDLTSATLVLEGSLDNENWYPLASHAFTDTDATELTDKAVMYHVVNKPIRYVRLNLSEATITTAASGVYTFTGEYESSERL